MDNRQQNGVRNNGQFNNANPNGGQNGYGNTNGWQSYNGNVNGGQYYNANPSGGQYYNNNNRNGGQYYNGNPNGGQRNSGPGNGQYYAGGAGQYGNRNGQYNANGYNPGKPRRKKSAAGPVIGIICGVLVLMGLALVMTRGGSTARPEATAAPAATVAPVVTTKPQTATGLLVEADSSYSYTAGTVIGSEQEFVNAAGCLRREGSSAGEFTLTAELFAVEKLHRLAVLAGMESYSCSYNADTRAVIYSEIVWSELPVLNCKSMTDLRDAAGLMAEQGCSAYTLVMDGSIYSTMCAGDYSVLLSVMGQQGVYGYDSAAADLEACSVTLRGVKTTAGAPLLETVEAALSYMTEKAELGETDYVLRCSPELFDLLLDKNGENGNGLLRAVELMDACGAMQGSRYTYDYTTHTIEYSIRYYGGHRIILAWRSGDFSTLTDRELQTYNAAVKLAAELTRATPAETVYAIHDRLCSAVYYKIDKNSEEDDQATGAILNGYANCDGYSDAFYLIGTLAGLEVRYQHGNTYGAEITDDADSTHVWNLVKLNGYWYNVDVTWDDTDDRHVCTRTYALLGSDRMGRTHYWCSGTNVPVAETTDLSLRPANEYYVTGEAELDAAAKSAAAANHDSIVFVFTPAMKERREAAFDYLRQYRSYGALDWYWEETAGVLTVFVR